MLDSVLNLFLLSDLHNSVALYLQELEHVWYVHAAHTYEELRIAH